MSPVACPLDAGRAHTALITACAPVGPATSSRDPLSLLPKQVPLAGAGPLHVARELLPADPGAAAARAAALIETLSPAVVVHLAPGTHAGGLRLVSTVRTEEGTRLEPTWPADPLAGRLRAHGATAEVCDSTDPLSAAVLDACLTACRVQGSDETLTGLLHLPTAAGADAPVEQEALTRLLVELIDQVRRHRAWREGCARTDVPRPARPLRVGLTGGIGSGKSTVARLLALHGAHVVDADALGREALAPGSTRLERLRERFGNEVLSADGAVNRPALAAQVFADPRARADLEAITLPWIAQRAAEQIEAVGPGHVGVYDVPLLAEMGMADLFDLVVVVEAPIDQRVARLAQRGLSPEQAEARMRAQATDTHRRALADIVLLNDGTEEDLAGDVAWLWAHRIEGALA